MPDEVDNFYTPRELAHRWRVSVPTINRHIVVVESADEQVPEGKIRAMRVGHQLRIHRGEVDRREALAVARSEQKASVSVRRQRRYSANPVDLIGQV